MDRTYLRFVNSVSAERIISQLQTAQHLWPHELVAQAVRRAGRETGFCPDAAQRAMRALQLDSTRQIGRLKRCELVQLGRAIHRQWLQAVGSAVVAPSQAI